MKYFVRKDASSVIEGPFELEAIRGWIAGGRFTNDFEAIEDTGRTLDQVRASRRWLTLEDVFAEPLPRRLEQAPATFLAGVRQNSCYRTLRLFVNLATVAGMAAIGFVTYWELSKRAPGEATGDYVLAGIVIVLVLIALIAIRQSALLFADIADILIEQNRKR